MFTLLLLLQFNLTIELSAQDARCFSVSVLDNPYPVYFLFDFLENSKFTRLDNYGYLVNPDKSNDDIYRQYIYTLKNGQFARSAPNKFYIHDDQMQLIDSIPNPTEFAIDFHDFISLSNGHYLMLVNETKIVDLSQLVEGGSNNAQIVNNILIETDNKGNIYWSWSSLDHLNILDVTFDIQLTTVVIDYCHINSMSEDGSGNILISIRHFDEISLIDKSTGNFIWRMGGTYCKNNQFQFVGDSYEGFIGFSHQHTPTIHPNGNTLINWSGKKLQK